MASWAQAPKKPKLMLQTSAVVPLVKLSTSKVVLCMECLTLPLAGPQLPLGVMVDLVLVIQQYSVGGGLGFGEDIGDVPIETFGKDGAFL